MTLLHFLSRCIFSWQGCGETRRGEKSMGFDWLLLSGSWSYHALVVESCKRRIGTFPVPRTRRNAGSIVLETEAFKRGFVEGGTDNMHLWNYVLVKEV